MRPARFVLGLLFAAAVLITFLKILFFVAAVAAVGGAVFLTFRALRYAMLGWEMSRSERGFEPASWPARFQSHAAAALPIDPRDEAPAFSGLEKRPVGRIVEVF